MAKEGRFAENIIGGGVAKIDSNVDEMDCQGTQSGGLEQYLERDEEVAGMGASLGQLCSRGVVVFQSRHRRFPDWLKSWARQISGESEFPSLPRFFRGLRLDADGLRARGAGVSAEAGSFSVS